MWPAAFPPAPHKPHPKTKFTPQEDRDLMRVIQTVGTADWPLIARSIRGRNSRQCRERWLNYLSPDVGNGPWTSDEERLLLEKVAEYGQVWKRIATFFNSRTDINVKSRWNLIQRRARHVALGQPRKVRPVRDARSIQPTLPETAPLSLPERAAAAPPPSAPAPTQGDQNSFGADDLWGSLVMNEDTPAFESWF
jgi:hypothetical protein